MYTNVWIWLILRLIMHYEVHLVNQRLIKGFFCLHQWKIIFNLTPTCDLSDGKGLKTLCYSPFCVLVLERGRERSEFSCNLLPCSCPYGGRLAVYQLLQHFVDGVRNGVFVHLVQLLAHIRALWKSKRSQEWTLHPLGFLGTYHPMIS